MNWMIVILLTVASLSVSAQAWKTLPKGVRILGYRNVTTSKVSKNFDQFRSESPLGATIVIDGNFINKATSGALNSLDPKFVNSLVVGEYEVDASAQFNVQGTGFGYGITNKVMFYGEIAYYNASVKARLKRTKENNFNEAARILQANGDAASTILAANLQQQTMDVNANTIQSAVTNKYGYQPIGDWRGQGYGDMETGIMANIVDRGYWGLLFYPGVVLPTGRQDDPDILQDVGFGDGQFDLFSEFATGYVVNDHLSFGTTLRYTYQAPSTKTLRIPESQDSSANEKKGAFGVKYGDRVNWMGSTTVAVNDWLAFSTFYRVMIQDQSKYNSDFGMANKYLAYNSNKLEHQAQFTTSISSIQPFLKKKFALPAQINMNVVRTLSGKNVPKVGRFELELRMLF